MIATPNLVQLRRIAWRVWDPIGLQSAQPDSDDEYDQYLIEVVRMLCGGKSPREAALYLRKIESDHIGLGRNEWETVTEVARYGEPPARLINRVQPPFEIIVRNAGAASPIVKTRLQEIAALLAEAKAEFDFPVSLVIEPS